MSCRYVGSGVAYGLLGSVLFVAGTASGQTLSITNYRLVSEQRVTRTNWNLTYSADMVNRGPAVNSVSATLSVSVANIAIVPGQNTLRFPAVPANGQVASSNTFTIQVDRSVPFNFADLKWTFQPDAPLPPVANAGPSQTAQVGSTVSLNASGSTNPSGTGTLTYSWAFTSRPAGSAATLNNATSVNPTFVVDIPGNYVIMLTVSNGLASASASVTVSTRNTAPVANAGPNQTVAAGATVRLSGSGSSDVDGNPLTYAWTLVTRPASSAATLTGANSVSPTFVADKPGTYVAELVVNDGFANSAPARVTITTQNTPPVANAGPNQTVSIGALVQLNGSASSDVDGNPLTFRWSLNTVPAGSAAALSNVASVNPTFTADRPGTYVAQLIVNDGTVDSAPATVTVTTSSPVAPTANAGPNQTVPRNSTVTLSGSGTDPQKLPLTFQWALITKPTGSAATLSGATVPGPTFVADRAGTYVAQLIVNNGTLSSPPSTVTITTANTPPVASAGANQNVTVGATVPLNASGSTDADNDPLTYAWSFVSRPQGSTATIAGANTVTAQFVADVAGTYVVQLIVNDGFANSNPVTTTVTAAAARTIALTPNPLNLSNAPGTLTVTLSAPAGSGGQAVSLTSSNTAVASVPASITVPEGATGANVTVTPGGTGGTATVTATASGFTQGTATVNSAAPLTIIFSPASLTITGTATQNLTLTLSAQAPTGGVTINLSSSNTGVATVPATVPFASGATSATVPVTGVAPGSAVIRASALPLIAETTANVTVASPGTISLQTGVAVGLGNSVPFSVNLSSPAPAGGVSVTLISSNTPVATVTGTVTIAAGATTPATQPQVTGVGLGTANISASAPNYTTASQPVNVTATVSFSPATLTITGTVTQNLTLTLSAPAPAGGVTINLSSSNPGVATVPATVQISAGARQGTVPVAGVTAGSAVIRASALPFIAEATANVTVVVVTPGTITVPAAVTVGAGQSVQFPIQLAAAAPAAVTLSLTSTNTSVATVTASVTIAAGSTTPATQPQVTGVSAGTTTISVTAPGYNPASSSVTVSGSTTGSITVANTAVGQNLQAPVTVRFSSPVSGSGMTLTLTSSDPSRLLISRSSILPGSGSLLIGLSEGTSVLAVYAQALGGSGTVTVTASAGNYGPGTGTMTLTPSGFVLASPNGLGSNFSADQGASVPIPVFSARLDASLNYVEFQPVRIGFSTDVSLTSSNPAVGTITDRVTIGESVGSVIATFTGRAEGSTTLTAVAPTGFSAPNQNRTVTAQVNPASISLEQNGTVIGQNLQTNARVVLAGVAPQGGLVVTVTSSNPNRLLLSTEPASGGSASISLTVAGGVRFSPNFYIQALASSGNETYTASAPGFGIATGTVTLRLSGFALSTPFGDLPSFTTAPGASDSPITVFAAVLDGSSNILGRQPLRGGLSVNVEVTSSNPQAGIITASPVTMSGGLTNVLTHFRPLSTGSTTLAASVPAGFTAPAALRTITANVSAAAMIITEGAVIGQNLQVEGRVLLTQPAPAGGLAVTLTSADPSRLLLSSGATAAGGPSVTLNIAAGFNNTAYYLQAIGNSGTVGYTARATGLADRTATVSLTPSGLELAGLFGSSLTTSVGAPPAPLIISTAQLSPGTNDVVAIQPLRGGFSLTVTLTNQNPTVGSVVSPVTIGAGSIGATSTFTPQATGSTTITLSQPSNFGLSNRTTVQVAVNP